MGGRKEGRKLIWMGSRVWGEDYRQQTLRELSD